MHAYAVSCADPIDPIERARGVSVGGCPGVRATGVRVQVEAHDICDAYAVRVDCSPCIWIC